MPRAVAVAKTRRGAMAEPVTVVVLNPRMMTVISLSAMSIAERLHLRGVSRPFGTTTTLL